MWTWFVDVVSDFCATPPPPQAAGAKVEHAAPAYLHYRMLAWIGLRLGVLAGIVGSMVGIETALEHSHAQLGLLPAILRAIEWTAAVGWVLSLPVGIALVRLDYEQRWYVISDRSLRIREGVVVVRDMTLTFVNVQNVTVEQGPLQRLFGIADLRVQTAGGGSSREQPGEPSMHTGMLRGISNAPALRERIMARLRAAGDAGLGDPDDASRARPGAPNVADAVAALLAEAKALGGAARRLAAARAPGDASRERST
jgi:membrane protein YdbS with pleckstrin-like domain